MSDKMVTVTKEAFFAALAADKRDIMPNHHDPDVNIWEVVSTRTVWGRSYPGWRNSGLPESVHPKTYELLRSMLDRA